ncbi:MAG TPA: S26 family signal peptidase, partial [Tepidisphaeraceae bacterium]|nr:S26 family signal peptidase [Tepidisphaeraceae bacterium]
MSADRSLPSADEIRASIGAPDAPKRPARTISSAVGRDPSSTASARSEPRPPAARPIEEGSIKETIESILVAFVLAFIFRAFVVEAFVIPTGSMAPTLMGAHMRFVCQDCGYRFDVNY